MYKLWRPSQNDGKGLPCEERYYKMEIGKNQPSRKRGKRQGGKQNKNWEILQPVQRKWIKYRKRRQKNRIMKMKEISKPKNE